MGSTDQIELVFLEENGDDFWTKYIGDTSFVFCPALNFFIGITPE
jgi:hypothetical protein